VHHVGSHSRRSGVAVYRAAIVVVALAEAKRRQNLPCFVPHRRHLAQSPPAADIGITRYEAEHWFNRPLRNWSADQMEP
jgi:hypothetical protein